MLLTLAITGELEITVCLPMKAVPYGEAVTFSNSALIKSKVGRFEVVARCDSSFSRLY